ncbi:hypothetical protein JD844_021853 [Phrynosoma platyrhinos]|uniref:VWFD domain-containing protein n=1 Tax=Phrynosoma platyrhinos TaxID=52577 RepID=A0ABQ7SU40_PHRPL|nr:hypothetical protein JD844_021853 [Phrynosoma platyrhinos]
MEPRFGSAQGSLLFLCSPQAVAESSPSVTPGEERKSSSAVPQKEDPSALGKQVFGSSVYNSSSTTVFPLKEKRFYSTTCQSSMHNTGAERDSICRTWGQYHYETFDGLYYFFSGKSTYCLVRQNEVDEQSFSIQVHNDPHCKSSPYFCKRSISLYFSGDGEIRLSKEVTYKGIGISCIDIIVHFFSGKLTEDIEEFVESWREDPPQENILSSDASFNYEPPCLTHGQSFLQNQGSKRENILMSILMCLRSGADNATWCRALTEYARSCAQAGKPLHNWRAQFEQCGMQ